MKKQTNKILFRLAALASITVMTACSGSGAGDAGNGKDTIASAQTPPNLNETPGNYFGIDISSYQGDEVAEIGPEDSLTFIICKATEGINVVDPDFDKNIQTIQSKKVIYGAYHFYHTDQDPVQQANHFWNTIKASNVIPEIAPIVDIEDGSVPQGAARNNSQIQQNLKTFLNTLEQLSGRHPMIYTGYDFGSASLTDPSFASYELWLAEYSGTAQPQVPATWKAKGYKIWQKRDNYNINSTQNDFDQYHGTKSDLTN